jgi:hypothetical protein
VPAQQILPVTSNSTQNDEEPTHVEALLRVFTTRASPLTPTRWGAHQPLKQRFETSSVPAITAALKGGLVLWKSPKSHVHLGDYVPGYKHGTLWADFEADTFAPQELQTFVIDLAKVLSPALAMVHLANDHDAVYDRAKDIRVDAIDGSTFGLHYKKLAAGLPDFYWGMVFGKPYCDLFGIERLLATPAHTVKRLGESLVYVQLTADVNDCEHNHAAIMQARQLAKRHLGLDAFMPDERDGLLAKVRQLPLIGKLMGHRPVAPVLVP